MLPFAANAVERASERALWFGNIYEFNGTIAAGYVQGHKEHNSQLRFNLDFRPATDWSAELEVEALYPVAKASLRYLWLDDVAGDLMSMSTGVSLAAVSHRARAQPLLQYHSCLEGKANVAVGKEFGFHEKGFWRVWGEGFLGAGRLATAWAGWHLQIDAVLKKESISSLFVEGERGFGDRHFHRTSFSSFAHIDYTTVDAGISYKHIFIGYCNLYASLKKRLSARSAPHRMTALEVVCEIPFSF